MFRKLRPNIISIIALITIVSLTNCKNKTNFNWGHRFSFNNNLNIKIDSLKISIGKMENTIIASLDSTNSIEGNIDVPKKGYPHKVSLKIFSGSKIIDLKTDSFDCYNCDGNHTYILIKDSAIYKFNP